MSWGSFPGVTVLLLLTVGGAEAVAEDWPTYQHDIARTGITPEQVPPPLAECWRFQSQHAPQPAWGDPKQGPVEGILELRRRHFDDVDHPVVAGGAVYFGSSADHKVSCLDLASGRIRWTFLTGGPVRLAPTVAEGRVYFGSDDGCVYCLNGADGSLAWRFRAAPEDQLVLGSGKMISLWPVRTGVLVDGGIAYFGAGIFPAEGVFLYAVHAKDGTLLWRNDSCGEDPRSGISPQGYLLASPATLYAPMGRVSPGAFDRRGGQFKFLSYFGKNIGGTYAMLVDDQVFTGTEEIVGYRQDVPRDRFATFAGRKLVVSGPVAYLATDSRLMALDRKAHPAASRRLESLRAARQKEKSPEKLAGLDGQIERAQAELQKSIRWDIACDCHESLILAGQVLYAGGAGRVVAVDAASGKVPWSAAVEGSAKGLAAAAGRILASTDKGIVYCFGPQGSPTAGAIAEPTQDRPFADSAHAAMFAQAAETIVKHSGVRRGYALVLGVKTGQLALELARRTELVIYAVSPDAATVAAARKAIDAAGLYGARVCVEQWPLDRVPYSDYFANLVVSETAMVDGNLPADAGEMFRMLKPLGGIAMIGQPSQRPAGAKPLDAESLRRWLAQSRLEGKLIEAQGPWAMIERGPLAGAGSWTHLYANPANTACGDDQIVRAPLGVLWFGNPGPGLMVSRHERAAGPLSIDGRLIVQGEGVLMAYDAYNGVRLWQRDLAGAVRVNASHDGSNLALSRSRLFVAIGDKCLGVDPQSGETRTTYQMPPAEDGKPRRWGYVACDDRTLYGTRSVKPTVSEALFALDPESGKPRWVYAGKQIPHNTIAVREGRVFLVDANVADADRQQLLATLPAAERAKADVRAVVALDAQTGQVAWKKPIDLAYCGGGNLAAMAGRDALVLFGVYLDGHYWQQFFAGDFASRRVTALSTKDGRLLWSKPVGYRVRPVLIGETLHCEPWAFDVATGEPRTRTHPVTGQTDRWQFARPGHHCGGPNGSPHCLFFRSYCLGYCDLAGDSGTMHFGAQRPGCWINFIPAGGLLLLPEASTGCMCPFANMCSVAFKPAPQQKGWSYFSAPGPMIPVRRLAVNFGAGGDRRDAQGNLWLGYPRPSGSLVLQFTLDTAFVPGGSFVARSGAYTPVSGTDRPWLFASCARGLTRCAIPLLGKGDGLSLYRVRLGFSDPDNDRPGVRVFDVKLQGKTVLEDFDVAAAASGRNKAVLREFGGIEVADKLAIELVPKSKKPPLEQAPLLQAVEIVREKVLRLGCSVPDLLLSTMEPKQSIQVQLANLRDTAFEGVAELSVPEGLAVNPGRAPVRLEAGARTAIPVEIALQGDVRPGQYPLGLRILRADGTLEAQSDAKIEHLGRRGRLVFKAVEDAHVQQRYPSVNRGSAGVLLVDGGDKAMGDTDHAVAYLKFRFQVPGKVLAVRFRIHNAGNPSGDSGRICLVTDPWSEKRITHASRPACGQEVGRLGAVTENQTVERPLRVDLEGKTELSLAIDPTSTDGIDYLSRESGSPPELIIDYEPSR